MKIQYVNPIGTFAQGDAPRNGILTDGPIVREFESRAAERLGAKFAIACSSGTIALFCLFRVLGLAGKEIIMPAFTWRSTAEAAKMAGARIVFADIDANTFLLDVDQVDELITDSTGAVCAVDCFGLPADYYSLSGICARHNIPLIGDSAHAFGATYHDKPLGEFGLHCYSFSPTKVLVGNEGGLITCNDSGLADELRQTRRWAGRMAEYNASCLLAGLKSLDRVIDQKREIFEKYAAMAARIGIETQFMPIGRESTNKDVCLLFDSQSDRDELQSCLLAEGVETRTYFTPATQFCGEPPRGYIAGDLKVTNEVYSRSLCVPSWPSVDVDFIVSLIESHFCRHTVTAGKESKAWTD